MRWREQCLVLVLMRAQLLECESDITGAKLPHETPDGIPQLKHWLACIELPSTLLKAKAELDESEMRFTMDLTEDKTYTKRKDEGLPTLGSS